MISNSKISNLVATQLPFYVRNDHENFVAFMEAYYEFLEQETGVNNVSKSLLNQQDIDLTDLFVEKFYENFLPFIPKDTAADKTLILKNVKDFYRARGTEKSIRFLMRLLFNEEVDFYYPQKDILRASDGKWFVEKSLKVNNFRINDVVTEDADDISKFIGRQITGTVSGAKALVESIDTYFEGESLVREMKISNLYKEFGFGEEITATFFDRGVEKTLKADLFSGGINTVKINNPGSGYSVGDELIIESNTGSGAVIIVSSVSTGDLQSIAAIEGGAGFKVNDSVLITGGEGTGAQANVTEVLDNAYYHPNTYNMAWTTIALERNTQLGNTRYSNLNASAIINVNSTIANAMSYFVYANTGPISQVFLYNKGSNYRKTPTISASANTIVQQLGILGRMEIVDGGSDYAIGDTIVFNNVFGGYGRGASGQVRNVSETGAITEVEFVPVTGHITGGSGYSQARLPLAEVVSATGNGANVIVTAVLGDGEVLRSVGTTEGSISGLSIINRGSGYLTNPTINLQSKGDGTAQVEATIIQGAYVYPGRYLNDDGHLSSYNFLEDRDYYQTFSYVVKVKQSIDKYRQAMKTLIHPAGMKLFGEYQIVDKGENLKVNIKSIADQTETIPIRKYQHTGGNVTINYVSHGLVSGNTVHIDWLTGNVKSANIGSNTYTVLSVVNVNNFRINTSSSTYLSNVNVASASGTATVIKINV